MERPNVLNNAQFPSQSVKFHHHAQINKIRCTRSSAAQLKSLICDGGERCWYKSCWFYFGEQVIWMILSLLVLSELLNK